ncbi:pre-mRNA-processing factor 17-like [Carassius gibelio]|uniref:pre-mRNA-processing factor 17-like n=1 Tax=Carassius gibelio TaxID=101364 RepID=UPI002279D2D0|nr:pre-mRNA-processing factor 17-like [Carassius gibelio]
MQFNLRTAFISEDPADERATTFKMAAVASSLVSYCSDSDSENESESGNGPQTVDPDAVSHLQPLKPGTLTALAALNPAPEVAVKEDVETGVHLDPALKEVTYNPSYETMFAPEFGPSNPFRSKQMSAPRNMLSGYAEPAHVNDFMFEQQRRTFSTFGYALDPSVDTSQVSSSSYIGAVEEAEKNKGLMAFETGVKKSEKRKKVKGGDASDIESFLGPWAKYQDERDVAKPSEDEKKELDEILAKRQKRGKNEEEAPAEEKTILHVKDAYDYQGRSYLHVPQDVGINLRSADVPDKCYLPKKQLHVWTGHTKGVSAIRLFPLSAHLLLSCSMDCKIKLWEVYNDRRCVRTFIGHSKAVRDVCFNNTGTQFLSAGYDRYLKLWDSETGQCISRFTNRKVPYCVKFNPDEDKQQLFVAGMSDKKIVQWDIRSGEVVQEYDRHLGAVNTITFVDENRRFVSTSDDKSLRVWEWDIPVDFKYIAEPSMHSMPAVTLSPNGKWLACQSMDNQILIFGAQNRFRLNKKKIFKGHMVAGYACQVDFSPDMSYVVSGDADGKLNIWDWKTTKLYHRIKAHDKVCISALWHPHETSKVITCGWDGQIKLWD